ncbi:MAG TPA: hypothetical protein GX497_17105 [Bacillus bacterium]|nr:hypothetical protein [Bacillus sp. (in: firmicutes)]
MDWGRTKTIFILIFLALDLFLVYQIIEKRTTAELEYMTESTIEEQLEADEITYGNLPKELERESYITAKRKKFISSDLMKLKNQTISFISDDWIISKLTKPIALPDRNIEAFLVEFLKENVISGNSYMYWGWDKKANKLLFFQTYRERPLFFNEYAMISMQLNKANEIISYEQKMMVDIKEIEEEGSNQEIIPPLKAIEILYNKDYLTSSGHITKVELGYYKNVPISEDVQIFVPTWHVVLDNEMDYFVNAIDGQIFQLIQSGVGENGFAF